MRDSSTGDVLLACVGNAPMSEDLTVRQLALRAKDGDADAWAQLRERYTTQLFGLLLVITGDRDIATGLTEQTFSWATERLGQLEDLDNVRAWLYRIARNSWRDVPRARRGMPCAIAQLSREGGHMLDNRASWMQIDPLGALSKLDLIARTLDDLDPSDRELLALRHYWQCSTAEIGELLELQPPTAQRRVGRAEAHFCYSYRALAGEEFSW